MSLQQAMTDPCGAAVTWRLAMGYLGNTPSSVRANYNTNGIKQNWADVHNIEQVTQCGVRGLPFNQQLDVNIWQRHEDHPYINDAINLSQIFTPEGIDSNFLYGTNKLTNAFVTDATGLNPMNVDLLGNSAGYGQTKQNVLPSSNPLSPGFAQALAARQSGDQFVRPESMRHLAESGTGSTLPEGPIRDQIAFKRTEAAKIGIRGATQYDPTSNMYGAFSQTQHKVDFNAGKTKPIEFNIPHNNIKMEVGTGPQDSQRDFDGRSNLAVEPNRPVLSPDRGTYNLNAPASNAGTGSADNFTTPAREVKLTTELIMDGESGNAASFLSGGNFGSDPRTGSSAQSHATYDYEFNQLSEERKGRAIISYLHINRMIDAIGHQATLAKSPELPVFSINPHYADLIEARELRQESQRRINATNAFTNLPPSERYRHRSEGTDLYKSTGKKKVTQADYGDYKRLFKSAHAEDKIGANDQVIHELETGIISEEDQKRGFGPFSAIHHLNLMTKYTELLGRTVLNQTEVDSLGHETYREITAYERLHTDVSGRHGEDINANLPRITLAGMIAEIRKYHANAQVGEHNIDAFLREAETVQNRQNPQMNAYPGAGRTNLPQEVGGYLENYGNYYSPDTVPRGNNPMTNGPQNEPVSNYESSLPVQEELSAQARYNDAAIAAYASERAKVGVSTAPITGGGRPKRNVGKPSKYSPSKTGKGGSYTSPPKKPKVDFDYGAGNWS